MPRARKLGKFRPPFVKRAIPFSACLASARAFPSTNFRNESDLIGDRSSGEIAWRKSMEGSRGISIEISDSGGELYTAD